MTGLLQTCMDLAVAKSKPSMVPGPLASPPSMLPGSFIKGIVDKQDNRVEVDRMSTAGYTHVSSMTYDMFCPRQRALLTKMGIPTSQKVTGGHRVSWARGIAAEAHVVESFQREKKAIMYGDWKCKCGKKHVRGHIDKGKACEVCGTKARFYKGLTFVNHDLAVTGACDLAFMIDGWLHICEIKSIENKDTFEALSSAKPNHKLQGIAYQRLAELDGLQVYPEVRVFYVMTAFKYGSPYKEFNFVPSDQDRTLIQALFNAAKAAWGYYKDKGELPERLRICPSFAESKTAQKCPAAGPCFELPNAE